MPKFNARGSTRALLKISKNASKFVHLVKFWRIWSHCPGCSTVVKATPCNKEDLGSTPVGLFSLFSIIIPFRCEHACFEPWRPSLYSFNSSFLTKLFPVTLLLFLPLLQIWPLWLLIRTTFELPDQSPTDKLSIWDLNIWPGFSAKCFGTLIWA